MNTATSFDAEEDIRNIFVRRQQIPDILICLDLVSTECAMQALVDCAEYYLGIENFNISQVLETRLYD